MWSTVRTLWPIPFGRMLDVTVLLDNWKIALSFAVVGRTFKPADLVNLSAKFTVGSAGTEGQGSIARVSECPFIFRCTQHPQGHVLRCILHYFVPSPLSAHSSSQASAFAQQVLWMCLQMVHGCGVAGETCSLTCLVRIPQQSPSSLSSGDCYTQCDKPHLSGPVSLGIGCP